MVKIKLTLKARVVRIPVDFLFILPISGLKKREKKMRKKKIEAAVPGYLARKLNLGSEHK